MEQILVGLIVFNAFFRSPDFQYDTFEVAKLNFTQNKESKVNFPGNEFSEISGISLGSREYDQKTSWLRYGHATYIYGQTGKLKKNDFKLKQYGGYVGLFLEVNYKRYFAIGTIVGGGASFTEYNSNKIDNEKKSNYFGLASPYMTVGLPLTKTASINLTASTYFLSTPSEHIDGTGEGFEPPKNLDNKIGMEMVWSWN